MRQWGGDDGRASDDARRDDRRCPKLLFLQRNDAGDGGDDRSAPFPGGVPASGYYEWVAISIEEEKKPRKQPYYITRKDGLPFTFAGLWERWKDGMLSFTILTTDAGATTRDLHDRMPV